jgi:hypothetical protein
MGAPSADRPAFDSTPRVSVILAAGSGWAAAASACSLVTPQTPPLSLPREVLKASLDYPRSARTSAFWGCGRRAARPGGGARRGRLRAHADCPAQGPAPIPPPGASGFRNSSQGGEKGQRGPRGGAPRVAAAACPPLPEVLNGERRATAGCGMGRGDAGAGARAAGARGPTRAVLEGARRRGGSTAQGFTLPCHRKRVLHGEGAVALAAPRASARGGGRARTAGRAPARGAPAPARPRRGRGRRLRRRRGRGRARAGGAALGQGRGPPGWPQAEGGSGPSLGVGRPRVGGADAGAKLQELGAGGGGGGGGAGTGGGEGGEASRRATARPGRGQAGKLGRQAAATLRVPAARLRHGPGSPQPHPPSPSPHLQSSEGRRASMKQRWSGRPFASDSAARSAPSDLTRAVHSLPWPLCSALAKPM